jgi:hypothetical protein
MGLIVDIVRSSALSNCANFSDTPFVLTISFWNVITFGQKYLPEFFSVMLPFPGHPLVRVLSLDFVFLLTTLPKC